MKHNEWKEAKFFFLKNICKHKNKNNNFVKKTLNSGIIIIIHQTCFRMLYAVECNVNRLALLKKKNVNAGWWIVFKI